MNTEMWIPILVVVAILTYVFYCALKSPFNPEAYEKKQRSFIKDSMRKPKKRKKPQSRAKATTVEAPHKGKSKRAKKKNKA